jgi:septal ring factor EnvC (AmiA/AmiB activator)
MDTILISLIIAGIGLALNVWAVNHSVNQGNVENAQRMGTIIQSLEDIRKDLESLKKSLNMQGSTLTDHEKRIIKLEESAKHDNDVLTKIEPKIEDLEKRIEIR